MKPLPKWLDRALWAVIALAYLYGIVVAGYLAWVWLHP